MEANRDQMIDHMTTTRGMLTKEITAQQSKKLNQLDRERSIEILNTFIKITNDRIDGYKTASEETEDEGLKALLFECLCTSVSCKEELIEEIEELGGTSVTIMHGDGPFFKAWMDAKVLLTGHNRQTILTACLHGEDLVEEAYRHLLTNTLKDISDDLRSILNAQYDLLITDREKIKSMRQSAALSE